MARHQIRCMISSSERVLGRNWCRDVGCTGRVAHGALAGLTSLTSLTATVTVTPTCNTTVGREVPAQQRSSHERWTAYRHAHVGHVGDGASPPVCLLLALIPPGNDEHGCAISSRDAHHAQGNTSRGRRLARRFASRVGAATVAVTKHVAITRSGGRTRGRAIDARRIAATIGVRARNNINGRVNLSSEVTDEPIIWKHGVQRRVGGFDVHAQGVDMLVRIG